MTVKQRAWLRHYRLGASAGEAAKLAGYQGADSRAFASIGARNRKRLAAWLEEFEEKSAAVADLEEVNAFWSAVMRDTGEDIRNRLKASELRAKAAALSVKRGRRGNRRPSGSLTIRRGRIMRRLNPAAFNPWILEHIGDYSRRLEVYCGGAGSGKSYGAAQKLLLKAMNSRRKVLAVRKVAATLRDSLFQLFLDLLDAAGLTGESAIHRSDMRFQLPNGSVFLFKGMDDREKIKSITGITDILIEEATELTEEDFLQLQLRLRPPEPFPQIYLLFNPVSRANWVYPYFFLHPPAEARVVRTTYRDNRFLDPDYGRTLEELKARSRPITASTRWANSPRRISGCIRRR